MEITQLNNRTTEIVVKLTTSGRYIWQITAVFPSDQCGEGIKLIASCDRKLKDTFPEYCKRSSGRTVELGEE
jgi:hypothetical protein